MAAIGHSGLESIFPMPDLREGRVRWVQRNNRVAFCKNALWMGNPGFSYGVRSRDFRSQFAKFAAAS